MKALECEEEFATNILTLLSPPADRQRVWEQDLASPHSLEPVASLPPPSPSQPEPAGQLISPKQWHTFLETGDPKQALRTTPTSTPTSRKPSVRRPLWHVKAMYTQMKACERRHVYMYSGDVQAEGPRRCLSSPTDLTGRLAELASPGSSQQAAFRSTISPGKDDDALDDDALAEACAPT